MTADPTYTGWWQSWPEMIVHTQTDAAADRLRRYCAVDDGDKPRYTAARFESITALNNDPNTIGPADILAVSLLSVNAHVPANVAIRLLGPDAGIVRELLSQIPVDVDIVDADPQSLSAGSPATKLWHVLRHGSDGLGAARTSKLMAAKRPRLLPIWDSFVEEAVGLDATGYWLKYRQVLSADHRRIWNWLENVRSQVPEMPRAISTLRILDILLWMSVEAD